MCSAKRRTDLRRAQHFARHRRISVAFAHETLTPDRGCSSELGDEGFHDEGIMFRIVGDSIAVTPPLIVSESQIGEIFEKVGKVIKALA